MFVAHWHWLATCLGIVMVLLTIISSSAVEHPACMQISRGRLHATFGCLERGCIAPFGDHCGMFSQSGPLERKCLMVKVAAGG